MVSDAFIVGSEADFRFDEISFNDFGVGVQEVMCEWSERVALLEFVPEFDCNGLYLLFWTEIVFLGAGDSKDLLEIVDVGASDLVKKRIDFGQLLETPCLFQEYVADFTQVVAAYKHILMPTS